MSISIKSDWLDVEEAAKYIGIGLSNLYALAQGGKIPSNKVGKIWKFNKGDLDTWIRVNKPLEEYFVSTPINIEDNPLIRDPQREAYQVAAEYFFNSENKKAIIQLPVGCGKSGLISLLPFGIAKGRVLVIAPNITIRQGLQKALDITDRRNCFWHKCKAIEPAMMMAGPFLAVLDGKDANMHDCLKSHIVLTNIQQLASSADRWLSQFPENFFDMILVDEGHHSTAESWMKVFEKFSNAKIVNLTATPFRSDHKLIQGKLIYRYSFKRAMIKGYIKKLQVSYIAPDEIYFTYNGDSSKHSLKEVMKLKDEEWFSRGVALSEECNKNIVNSSLEKLEAMRLSGVKHQLIAVACSVSHAKSIRSLYAERGYEVDVIHSQMPENEKSEVIQKLRMGLLDCIVQVQMLGEGFDHPNLSIAAIFRPFRSLPPFIQFVGRVLRAIHQNQPNSPDNIGWVVTHIGLNQDILFEDFKDLEREDQLVFLTLLEDESNHHENSDNPDFTGRKRFRLREPMVVHQEVVSSFLEEDFIDSTDAMLIEEMKIKAEALGFDPEYLESALKKLSNEHKRIVVASAPFPVSPQAERKEARKRLSEEVKRASTLLLNRLDFKAPGRELSKIWGAPNNYVATVQKINKKLQQELGVESGQYSQLTVEQLRTGKGGLDKILNDLTREAKGLLKNGQEEREDTNSG
jgi:DNA repair protein RadD